MTCASLLLLLPQTATEPTLRVPAATCLSQVKAPQPVPMPCTAGCSPAALQQPLLPLQLVLLVLLQQVLWRQLLLLLLLRVMLWLPPLPQHIYRAKVTHLPWAAAQFLPAVVIAAPNPFFEGCVLSLPAGKHLTA